MDKKFCPSCGNNTLLRTSVGVDNQGNLTCHLKKSFQYNNRGTKYSIPQSKGGREGDIILREDQKEYQRAIHSLKKKIDNGNVFDPDYVALDSNRSSLALPVIGFGRKNVNANSKPRRR